MKKILKGLLINFSGKENFYYFYLKLREIYFKIFLSSDKIKEKYINKKFKQKIKGGGYRFF